MKNFKFEDEAEDIDVLAEDDLDLVEDDEEVEQVNEVRYIDPANLDKYDKDEIEEVTTASGEKRYKRKSGAQSTQIAKEPAEKEEPADKSLSTNELLTVDDVVNVDSRTGLSDEQENNIVSDIANKSTSDTIDTLTDLYSTVEKAYRTDKVRGRNRFIIEDVIKKIDDNKLIDIAKSLNLKTKDIDKTTLLNKIYRQLERKADDKIWLSSINDDKPWRNTEAIQQQIKHINDTKGAGNLDDIVQEFPKKPNELAKAIKDVHNSMSNPLAFSRLINKVLTRNDIATPYRRKYGGFEQEDHNSYLRCLLKELKMPIKYDKEGWLWGGDIADRLTDKLYGKDWVFKSSL